MSDNNMPDNDPGWVKEIGKTLDRSLDELDQPVREQLSKRRQQLIRSVKKNRFLKRTAWVGMAAAASVMAIMVMPGLHQPERLLVQDDLNPLLQHLELLEEMDILESMGEVPGDV